MQSELLDYFQNDHAGPGLLLAEAYRQSMPI